MRRPAAAAALLCLAAAASGEPPTLFSGRELGDAAGGLPAAESFSLVPTDADAPRDPDGPPAARECVLLQCRSLPVAPAKKVFDTAAILWTSAGLLIGIIDGMEGPIHYGVHPFHFTDESYFQSWTYGGGSDKVSHFVISADTAGLLYDAYRLNGLSDDQSFALSFGTAAVGGAFVEIGDGLTPYGFSAQDWTADALGALSGSLIKRLHADDLLTLRIGKTPTTIPPALLVDRTLFGIDYSNEIYSLDASLSGAFRRVGTDPGPARFLLTSFVYMTKGFGYDPPLPSRYQEVGFEVGLNFPEILRALGVDRSTWWGDTLLRIFQFFRIPYTQIGAYYNLKNQKWYGPGAPYHYY
ncbi:MAG: DUF2279 domain-containing protein [Syntrophomonadaceae bacterium]